MAPLMVTEAGVPVATPLREVFFLQ